MTPSSTSTLSAESTAIPCAVWSSTFVQILGRVGASLCQLAVLLLLARRLEAAEFGRLTFYLALFLFLDVFTDFGSATAALERGASGGTEFRRALSAGRRVRTGTALLSVLGVALGVFLAREEDLAWILGAALVFLTRPLELSSIVFQNRIAWTKPVFWRTFAAFLRLGFALLAWSLGARSFGPFLLAHAAGGALGNVLVHLAARRELHAPAPPQRGPPRDPPRGPSAHAEPLALSAFLARALPLAATGILQQAYFYVDNLFVRPLAGDEELGRYNACVKLFSFAVLVASYVSSSAFPWLVRRREAGGPAELGRATLRLSLPLTLGACTVLGGVFPFAGPLLRLVFGPDFASAASALRWLLAAAAVVHAGSGLLTGVLATGRMRAVLAITLAGLALNVLLNLALVPERGIEGAALATFLTEALVALLSVATLLAAGARALLHPAWLAGPVLFVATAGLTSFAASLA